MTTPLKDQSCRPVSGAPMTATEVQALLTAVPDWALDGDALARTFQFPDFHRTMAFVNAVAWIAHVQDHHPDMDVGYGRCTLRWRTHAVGGLSMNDFICAARVDALGP